LTLRKGSACFDKKRSRKKGACALRSKLPPWHRPSPPVSAYLACRRFFSVATTLGVVACLEVATIWTRQEAKSPDARPLVGPIALRLCSLLRTLSPRKWRQGITSTKLWPTVPHAGALPRRRCARPTTPMPLFAGLKLTQVKVSQR
jgi:hypothetical protein